MIIHKGQALVCKDNLAVRKLSKEHAKNHNLDKDFPQLEKWHRRPEIFHASNKKRVYQNKRIFVDDDNNRIPKEFAVYKDLMVYGNIHKGQHFGGRVLLQKANIKNMEK